MSAAVDAIVIGAGTNGLAAAAALAKAGRRVLLLERSDAAGGDGRSAEFAPGFRAPPLAFDSGWLPPRVAVGLGLDGLALVEPETAVSVATGPGELLSLSRDPGRAADAIRPHSARDAERWEPFTARLRNLAGFLEHLYQIPPTDIDSTSLGDILGLAGLALKFRMLGREDMTELLRTIPMSIQELVDDWFECEPLKAAVAAGGVQEIRQGPRSGGTAFVLLHHLVGAPRGSIRGRGFWRDGPDALTSAIEAQARGRGVTVRTRAEVTRILVQDDAVTGVALADGEEIAAPVVISTADPARTLLGLVDPVWLDPEFLHSVRQIKFRGSHATVLFALDGLPDKPGRANGAPPDALAGVVTLTPSLERLERAYDSAKYGMVSERLHVEVTVPSLLWPTLAPAGKHVMVARAGYTPYRLRDGEIWNGARAEELEDKVTRAIGEIIPGLAERVLHRTVLTPKDMEDRYGVTEGAVTHGELTLDQILFMRPVAGWGHYAMPIAGLYLGGAGAHPGPGVLGGPGWLAARRVLADGKT